MPDTTDTSVKSASGTQMLHKQHEYGMSTTWTSAVQVKNFDFENDASGNIFLHSYISYIANERLQGKEQFHSKIEL